MKTKTIKQIILGTALGISLFAGTALGGGVLTVNSPSFGNVCDDKLSLLEAAELALGRYYRSLTTGEKNQISGATWLPAIPACGLTGWVPMAGIGGNSADDIFFTNDVGTLTGGIILGLHDDINGLKPNGQKVVLDGTGLQIGSGIFLDVSTGSQVRNLVIRNFPGSGIIGFGLSGAKFEGLEISNNALGGITLKPVGGANSKNIRNGTIGGDQPQHRNLIFGNGGHGILLEADPGVDREGSQNINILNNFIGTSDGTTDNGNAGNGILLSNTFGVTIGGTAAAARNIISGNQQDGIKIIGANAFANTVTGNFIGTNAAGNAPLGNNFSGVALTDGCGLNSNSTTSPPNRIGMPGAPNLISGNGWGVFIGWGNPSKNIVQSNFIGSNLGGSLDIGNLNEGVYLANTSAENIIGGPGANEANMIAFNNRNGIYQDDGARNSFARNRVFSNDMMGIDIAPAGANPNDNLDGDSGPNSLLNYPVITYLLATTNSINIKGTYNSSPNRTYRLDFFGNFSADQSGYGEGYHFLGSTQVTTNASGNANFDATFTFSQSLGLTWVTATATDSSNNTSEYSQARHICADMVLSPFSIYSITANRISGNFSIINSAGCSYSVQSYNPWIALNSVSAAGNVSYTLYPNFGPSRNGRIWVMYNNGSFATAAAFNAFQWGGPARQTPMDFDGDGITDPSISRVSGANRSWQWQRSSNLALSPLTQFGLASDIITPADFTGDGKTDVAVFRPSSGEWYILRSEDSSFYGFPFGLNGDIPAPADYDGDGKADAAVYRPSALSWYILRSSDQMFMSVPFGTAQDKPAVGDFDGDGKADISLWNPTTRQWSRINSSNSTTFSALFGQPGDKPVQGDYTGDGKADLAVYTPATGVWTILRSDTGLSYNVQWGNPGDLLAPGDYDGDYKFDPAVFRPSQATWYALRSGGGSLQRLLGASGDTPLPGAFIP